MNLNHDDSLPPQPGIRRYFVVQRRCFARLGLNFTSLDHTLFSYFKVWFPMLLHLNLYGPVVMYAMENINDLDEVTTALSPLWQSIIATFKIIYFIRHRKKIVVLIRKLWLWNLEAKNEEYDILAAENRKDIIYSTFYNVSVHATCIFLLLAPLLFAGFYAFHGESFWDYLEEPIKASYIIDKSSIFCYILIYIINFCAIYFVGNASISVESLFSWFTFNIVSQFRILKYRLHRAGAENNGNCSMKTINDCIGFHCRAIELASEFNDVFCVVIFIKFLVSCMQICCLAFLLNRGGVELFDKMFHGLFLISVTVQLMMYCYGGQMIQDESNSIANEIYENFQWQSLSLANRKILIFSIMRSQKPCNISGIFFTANLNLFLWVYRTAASMITLLKTMEEEDMQ